MICMRRQEPLEIVTDLAGSTASTNMGSVRVVGRNVSSTVEIVGSVRRIVTGGETPGTFHFFFTGSFVFSRAADDVLTVTPDATWDLDADGSVTGTSGSYYKEYDGTNEVWLIPNSDDGDDTGFQLVIRDSVVSGLGVTRATVAVVTIERQLEVVGA